MSSFFRIDRNSIHKDDLENASIVQIPGLADVIEIKKEEPEEPEQAEDAAAAEQQPKIDEAEIKRKELEALQQQIGAVKKQAEEILANANIEAEEIKSKAREEGYAAGVKQAQEEFEEAVKAEKGELKRAMLIFGNAKKEIVQEMESCVLDLSIFIAEKVIKQEVENNKELYLNIIKEVIETIQDQEDIILRVNKQDYDHYFADDMEDFTALLLSSGVTIKPDMAVTAGECVVESEYGTIRSGFKTQLERISAALKEVE